MRTRRRRGLECLATASLAAFAVLAPTAGVADCQCLCVNGEVETICSNALDIRPICAPRICPIVPPAVRPIDPPRVPPIGTSECRSEQVWNGEEYEWVEICR